MAIPVLLKHSSGAIGTTQALTLIDVDNAAIFNGSIEATTLSVAASNYALEQMVLQT